MGDALFRRAVEALDAGDLSTIERLLEEHPDLACTRLDSPGAWLKDKVGAAIEPGGFFERPFLLWFVSEDAVRAGTLPANIVDIARAIIGAAKRADCKDLRLQLDYGVRLVAWSWIARECGSQIPLIDLFVSEGAALPSPVDPLVNGNFDAATRLIELGAQLNLASALCLSRWSEADRLLASSTAYDRQAALALCGLLGNAEALRRLIAEGVDVSAYSTGIFEHATALHHAVGSGCLAAVQVLVAAGADLSIRDTAHNGTPLGWAEYYVRERGGQREHSAIADFLRGKGAPV